MIKKKNILLQRNCAKTPVDTFPAANFLIPGTVTHSSTATTSVWLYSGTTFVCICVKYQFPFSELLISELGFHIKWTWLLIKQQYQMRHIFSLFLGRCMGRLVRCSKFIQKTFWNVQLWKTFYSFINMFDCRCRCQTGLLFNEYKILSLFFLCYSYRTSPEEFYMYRHKHMCIGKLFFRSNYFRNNLQCDWPRNVDCKRSQPSQFSQPAGLTTQSQWELLPTTPSSVSGAIQQSDVQTCKDSESTACRSTQFMFATWKMFCFS